MGNTYSRTTNGKPSFSTSDQLEDSEYYVSPTALTVPFENIQTLHNDAFKLSIYDFIDHIQLLREAIEFIDVIQDEDALTFYIDEYCRKIANDEFIIDYHQQRLPWPLIWIWYLHRLHPIAYYNDCTTQLERRQLLDPKSFYTFSSSSVRSIKRSFVPSIDLVAASIDQIPFLEKFQEHCLYSWDLERINHTHFHNMVQNYMSFLKSARHKQPIMPTFDIGLIWHTHLQYPIHYRCIATALCGYVLDHNDLVDEVIEDIVDINNRRLRKSRYSRKPSENRERPTNVPYINLSSIHSISEIDDFDRSTCLGSYRDEDKEEKNIGTKC